MNKRSLTIAAAVFSAWSIFAQTTGPSTSKEPQKITLEQLADQKYTLSPQIRKELQQYLGSIVDPCERWSIEAFGPLELKLNDQSKTIREGPYINHFVFPADKEFYFNVPKKATGNDPITAFDIIFKDESGKIFTYDGLAKQPIKLKEGLYYVEFKAYTDKIGSDKVKRRIQYASVRGWATGKKDAIEGVFVETPKQVYQESKPEPKKEESKVVEEKPQTVIKNEIIINNYINKAETTKEEPEKVSIPKDGFRNLLFGRVTGFTERMNDEPYFTGFSTGLGAQGYIAPYFFMNGSFDFFFGKFDSAFGDFKKYEFELGAAAKNKFQIANDFGILASLGLESAVEMTDINYDVVQAWIGQAKIGLATTLGIDSKYIDLTAIGSIGTGISGDSFQGGNPLFYYAFKLNPEAKIPFAHNEPFKAGYIFGYTNQQQEVRGIPRDKAMMEHTGYLAFPLSQRLGMRLFGKYVLTEGLANRNEGLHGGLEINFKF